VEVEVPHRVADREGIHVLRPEGRPLGGDDPRRQGTERRERLGSEVVEGVGVALGGQDEPAAEGRPVGDRVEDEAPLPQEEAARGQQGAPGDIAGHARLRVNQRSTSVRHAGRVGPPLTLREPPSQRECGLTLRRGNPAS
jgi:hypothetical protein